MLILFCFILQASIGVVLEVLVVGSGHEAWIDGSGDQLRLRNALMSVSTVLSMLVVSLMLKLVFIDACTGGALDFSFHPVTWRWVALPLLGGIAIAFLVGRSAYYLVGPEVMTISFLESIATMTLWFASCKLLVECLLVPVFEEVIFRGALLPMLSERYGTAVAGTSVVAVFTFWHIGAFISVPLAVLPIFVLAVLLTYIRIRARSVVPCIALHTSYNASLLLFF